MKETTITSIDDLIKQINDFEALSNTGLLGLLGLDTSEITSQISSLRKEVDRFASTIQDFNPLFRDRGWIVSDHSNTDIIENCISLARKGEFEEAEQRLIDFYSPQNIRDRRHWFWHFKSLKNRSELIDAALDDYMAGRFTSCIPLTLMIIDGFISDDHPDQKGFFASGHTVYHHDSIAAQRDGLEHLYKLFNSTRKATNLEEIFLPYRNGILHGRDVRFGNAKVAAKSWALLLSLMDWRRREEKQEESSKKEEDEPLAQTLERYAASQRKGEEIRKAVENWKKPEFDFERLNIEEALDYFDEGTPGHTAAQFLQHWQGKKLGLMAQLCHYHKYSSKPEKPLKEKIKAMKDLCEDYDVTQSQLTNVEVESTALAEVEFTASFWGSPRNFAMRLIRVDTAGEVVPTGIAGGEWRVLENMIFPARNG